VNVTRQIPENELAFVENVTITAKIITIIGMVITFLFAASLHILWGTIAGMQM